MTEGVNTGRGRKGDVSEWEPKGDSKVGLPLLFDLGGVFLFGKGW